MIASPDYSRAHGLKPRARIVMSAVAGAEPVIMLTAPAPASKKCLERARMSTRDIDLWEINEAFAAVALHAMRELGISNENVNVNGGAIALGHPIGATGARIMVTLIHALQAKGLKRGLATLCIGGGEGTAMALELL
jgi:acetyl-CoA C-acetyltransferase